MLPAVQLRRPVGPTSATLHVDAAHRRRGVASWLLGQGAEWLRLGHVDRLLDYGLAEESGYLAFMEHVGFRPLTTTTREWERRAPFAAAPACAAAHHQR